MRGLSTATVLGARAACILGEARWRNADSIADGLSASANTLVKALKKMVKAGILESKRGPTGGFRLARPLEDISLGAVEEALCGELPKCCQLHLRPVEACPLCRLADNTRTLMGQMPLSTMKRKLK